MRSDREPRRGTLSRLECLISYFGLSAAARGPRKFLRLRRSCLGRGRLSNRRKRFELEEPRVWSECMEARVGNAARPFYQFTAVALRASESLSLPPPLPRPHLPAPSYPPVRGGMEWAIASPFWHRIPKSPASLRECHRDASFAVPFALSPSYTDLPLSLATASADSIRRFRHRRRMSDQTKNFLSSLRVLLF